VRSKNLTHFVIKSVVQNVVRVDPDPNNCSGSETRYDLCYGFMNVCKTLFTRDILQFIFNYPTTEPAERHIDSLKLSGEALICLNDMMKNNKHIS